MSTAIIPSHFPSNSNGVKEKVGVKMECALQQSRNIHSIITSNRFEQKNCISEDEIDNGGKLMKENSILQKDMKVEKNRLETFGNSWPLAYIDPSDLAAVGFFYLNSGDKVQCVFCKGIILDWAPGDDPLTEHTIHFPLCPFLLKRNVGNIPLLGKKSFLDRFENSHPEKSEFFKKSKASFSGENSSPKFFNMVNKDKRLRTFTKWNSSAVHPETLAEAGFFYTGESDIATCFYCGGTLGHWDDGDNPCFEHKKHFPHCSFINTSNSVVAQVASQTDTPMASQSSCSQDIAEMMKSEVCLEASKIFSENSVKKALTLHLGQKGKGFDNLEDLCTTILEILDESSNISPGVQSQKLQIESKPDVSVCSTANTSGDRHICKICCDKEVGVVFLPCGHMVACPDCSQAVKKCPVCRCIIENAVRAYLS